jgi:hypothetical protein
MTAPNPPAAPPAATSNTGRTFIIAAVVTVILFLAYRSCTHAVGKIVSNVASHLHVDSTHHVAPGSAVYTDNGAKVADIASVTIMRADSPGSVFGIRAMDSIAKLMLRGMVLYRAPEPTDPAVAAEVDHDRTLTARIEGSYADTTPVRITLDKQPHSPGVLPTAFLTFPDRRQPIPVY